MFHRTVSPRRSFRGTLAPALLLTGVFLLLVLGACSSDDPSTVGDGLVEVELEALLDTLDIGAIDQYRGIPVDEEDLPVRDHEALYLGEQDGTASSIIAQFDFDAVLDTVDISVFTASNISSVRLRMRMLKAYTDLVEAEDDGSEDEYVARFQKQYLLYHLGSPVDTLAFPGPEPSVAGLTNQNANETPDESGIITMPILSVQNFVNWMEDGGEHAFAIRQSPVYDTALVGYASRDNVHGGSTLEETSDFDTLGPTFIVHRIDTDEDMLIPAYFDCSTFHSIEEAPADPSDGFILRTSLRSYPALHFDMSVLPEDVLINRAVLAVANDTLSAYGTSETIVVSEFPVDLFGAAGDTLELDEIGAETYGIVGMSGLQPTSTHRMEFNITTAVQRIVNGAYEGTRGFILTAGEDFTNYDTSTLDPDLYLNQFVFYGPNATDPVLRPRLKITYSVAGSAGGVR